MQLSKRLRAAGSGPIFVCLGISKSEENGDPETWLEGVPGIPCPVSPSPSLCSAFVYTLICQRVSAAFEAALKVHSGEVFAPWPASVSFLRPCQLRRVKGTKSARLGVAVHLGLEPSGASQAGLPLMDYKELILQYADSLRTDLTWASKTHINMLTMLAAENKAAAASICATIERHILSVGNLLKISLGLTTRPQN